MPSAAAAPFKGSLAADQVFLQGAVAAANPTFLARLGGDEHSFSADHAPSVALTGREFTVEHAYRAYHDVAGMLMPDDTRRGVRVERHANAATAFQAWLPSDAELVVQTENGAVSTGGRVEGYAPSPTPLKALAAKESWSIEPPKDASVGFPSPYTFHGLPGDLVLSGADFAKRLAVEGDFSVYVYGADLRINGASGSALYPSGMRKDESTTPPTYWLNVTRLHVLSGDITIEPGTNPVVAYVHAASLEGEGALLLRGATGHLQEGSERAVALQAQDMDLVGSYALDIRGGSHGFLATVAGDFDADLVPFSTITRPGSSQLWWLLIGLGLVVATSGGSALIVARRKAARRTPAPVALVPAPAPVAEVAREVSDAQHMDPAFGWDAINEEFGVVRAGEKAGVLIVLVPEDKTQAFLAAVVQRGLMAEDTGDRVHAGDNTLAVIALEPSPLMMN